MQLVMIAFSLGNYTIRTQDIANMNKCVYVVIFSYKNTCTIYRNVYSKYKMYKNLVHR